MKKIAILIFISLLFKPGFSQSDDNQIGTSPSKMIQSQGALYDFSDPEALNIRVAVWGQVRYPGRYIIPSYSSVNDLISFSGGPTIDADLDDLRIFRTEEDSSQVLIKFNYNDLLWNKSAEKIKEQNIPKIKGSDILLVPGQPRLFFKDWLTISLAVVSTLISLAILIKK